MSILNRIVGFLFDALVYPLRGVPPFVSLAVISLLVAIGMLLVIRATSNQAAIAAAKQRIWAGLFEIRLFNDDPRAILRAQRDVLRHNLTYLRLSLVPMLWMLVPLVLVMAQLQSFYGYRALRPGDTFLLQMQLQPGPNAARPDVQLRVPDGLRAETAEVWLPSLSELAWRVRAERAGRYAVDLQLGGEAFAKDVQVNERFGRLSPVRHRAGLLDQLLYPSEPPLPKSRGVESLRVKYPSRDFGVLGLRLPWIVVFLLMVTAFALALKNRLRVTF